MNEIMYLHLYVHTDFVVSTCLISQNGGAQLHNFGEFTEDLDILPLSLDSCPLYAFWSRSWLQRKFKDKD